MRWQYYILNLGTISTIDRLVNELGRLGADGWEVCATLDKSSNWLGAGYEKAIILLKRPVRDGEEPDGAWATGSAHHVLARTDSPIEFGPSGEVVRR